MQTTASRTTTPRQAARANDEPISRFSQLIGRSRFVVLIAVLAVLVVAGSLFLLGTLQAVFAVWHAWQSVIEGQMGTANLTVEFLEIVSTMLKAVVFYLIAVGLYSLFISPLNLAVSLGVETFNDLESQVISVVIVILGVTFLEHFIRWEEPLAILQFGGAMALVVGVLVLFQMHSHRVKTAQVGERPHMQARARRELFESEQEEHEIDDDEVAPH